MKRTAPLRAYAPPRRSTALTARTGLSRTAPLRSAASGKPQKASRGAQPQPFPPAACVLIDTRDVSQPDLSRCCQRCGSTRDLERHHRRGKASGGSRHRPHAQCPCNACTLCAPCHRHVHRKGRVRAEAEGFIVSQSVDWPGSVSVMRFAAAEGGASQYPSCDGRWDDEPAREAA